MFLSPVKTTTVFHTIVISLRESQTLFFPILTEEIAMIFEHVNKHASSDVKYHALYGYYHLGLKKTAFAKNYKKDKTTITNWIDRYEGSGSVDRKTTVRPPSKFDNDKKQWLLDLYKDDPILFLDEAKSLFEQKFGMKISPPYICKILHDNKMTWKRLEVRAMQIRDTEVG